MAFDLFSFLSNNWQNIVVSFVFGLLFYLLSNYGIKSYLSSAYSERVKHAKVSLLDILESRVINKQEITLEIINNLIEATDRENEVDLKKVVTPISLLQDLNLNFEKSHHLDSSQKKEYCNIILSTINSFNEQYKKSHFKSQMDVLAGDSKIFNQLREQIKSKNIDCALDTLDALEKHVIEEKYIKSQKYNYISSNDSFQIITAVASFIASILFYFYSMKSIIHFSTLFFTILLIAIFAIGYEYLKRN